MPCCSRVACVNTALDSTLGQASITALQCVVCCRLAIVGGGYIAAEQACIYNNFGTEVSMYYRGKHILSGMYLLVDRVAICCSNQKGILGFVLELQWLCVMCGVLCVYV